MKTYNYEVRFESGETVSVAAIDYEDAASQARDCVPFDEIYEVVCIDELRTADEEV